MIKVYNHFTYDFLAPAQASSRSRRLRKVFLDNIGIIKRTATNQQHHCLNLHYRNRTFLIVHPTSKSSRSLFLLPHNYNLKIFGQLNFSAPIQDVASVSHHKDVRSEAYTDYSYLGKLSLVQLHSSSSAPPPTQNVSTYTSNCSATVPPTSRLLLTTASSKHRIKLYSWTTKTLSSFVLSCFGSTKRS